MQFRRVCASASTPPECTRDPAIRIEPSAVTSRFVPTSSMPATASIHASGPRPHIIRDGRGDQLFDPSGSSAMGWASGAPSERSIEHLVGVHTWKHRGSSSAANVGVELGAAVRYAVDAPGPVATWLGIPRWIFRAAMGTATSARPPMRPCPATRSGYCVLDGTCARLLGWALRRAKVATHQTPAGKANTSPRATKRASA